MFEQKLILEKVYQRVCCRCENCYHGSKHSKVCPQCQEISRRKKIERRVFN